MPRMIQVLGEGTDEQEIRFEPGVVLRAEVRTYEVEIYTINATTDLTDEYVQSIVIPRIAIKRIRNLPGQGLSVFFHVDTTAPGLPGYVPIALAARG